MSPAKMKLYSILAYAAASGALVIPGNDAWDSIAVATSQRFEHVSKETHSRLTEAGEASNVLPDVGEVLQEVIGRAQRGLESSVPDAPKSPTDNRLSSDHRSPGQEDSAQLVDGYQDIAGQARTQDWWHGGHHKPDKSVYELIAGSKYTTKLASLIDQYEDLVDLVGLPALMLPQTGLLMQSQLNGTSANFTVFAPTDCAFAKIPKHAPEPSKEFLKDLLTYHISEDFYPAFRLLSHPTIATLLPGNGLSTDPKGTPQRLSYQVGFFAPLTLNYYAKVVAVNIFGTNGVVHGIDSILVPPIKAAEAITFVPTVFSTLELGLRKTGLYSAINDTSNHLGGTLFAPTNSAFAGLGFKANAFLFSECGQKYLKALLKYHVAANQTLYTDEYYPADKSGETTAIPKGKFHVRTLKIVSIKFELTIDQVDLQTLLHGHSLSIDIARFGGLIDFRINGFTGLAAANLVAADGVVHVLSSVLIPPKEVNGRLEAYKGEELTEEELKKRLEPLVNSAASDTSATLHGWEL